MFEQSYTDAVADVYQPKISAWRAPDVLHLRW
jgi:hypothetical protein